MIKFFIDQHGCAKNQTDGELIAGYLQKQGFELTQNADEAAFIFVNSCGFINSAKKESIDAVCSIKKAYPEAKVILTGCLAERYSKELYDSMPELDGVFGNGDLSKIVDFMKSIAKERAVSVFPQKGVCGGSRPLLFNFPATVFVKITEGCSNHCSFCAIPLIRGELRSRPEKEILNEITELVNDGIYEINLIGQDLAAYGTDTGTSLAALLTKISKIKGDFVIRPLYIHPDHFTDDIISAIKSDKRFLPYFDIPFQSGDDDIIRAMNRTGSYKTYTDLISKIRRELPDAVLRTTFLTGFPGETDAAAETTARFLQEISPDWSGCFPYSREEDTPAYDMKPRIPAKTAKARASRLEELQTAITTEHLKRYIGQEFKVLVEELIPEEGLAIGRAWFQAPDVDGSVVIRFDSEDKTALEAVKPGNVVLVKALASTGVDLDACYIRIIRKFNQKNERKFIF